MAASARSPYAWARRLDVSAALDKPRSDDVEDGLDYAEWLADNAYERAQDPRRLLRPEKITLQELAEQDGLTLVEAERLVALARRHFFGRLSDAAIAKRAQRQQDRQPRTCTHPDCRRPLPETAHGNRRYCPTHAKGKARTRRHRANKPKKKNAPADPISRTDAAD